MGNNNSVLENEEKKEMTAEETAQTQAEGEATAAENTDTENTVEKSENDGEQTGQEDTEENLQEESEPSFWAKLKDNAEKINRKKVLIVVGIAAAALAAAYGCGVLYYSSHFFFNTEIGNFDCSNLTVEAAKEKIQNEIDNYSFTFYEKNGEQETITGDEIHLKCAPIENLDELKAKQNAFAWLTDRKNRSLPLDIEVEYNKDALYNRITQMDFAAKTRENMEGAFDEIYYENGAYYVRDDGTKDIVSVNSMYDKLKPKIKELYKGMSMEKESCYGGIADDDNMKGVLNLLNKYVSAKVTYKKGDKSIVLDRGTINNWLSVGENYSVNIDKEQIRAYVNTLAEEYNTVGRERKFKTTNGEVVTVAGGNYGWLVDNKKETEELFNVISDGGEVEREPVYKQTAAAHGADNDFAGTYAEVSIGAQHLWFYKNGEQVISSDFVSGNPYKGNATPTGIYYVVYKDKDAILKGEDYETPVSFWMPFNGGIGFHDATWRGRFGGTIYQGGGSHGCINLPYNVASQLFELISPGDPVIVY
ncbi:MAG: L,D-transpeptidase/peptidoglycan binding protein [Hominilimicola sp.]